MAANLARLRKCFLPAVIINSVSRNLSYVTTDHRGGAFQAVDYLLGLGHREIAIAGRPLSVDSVIRERFRGYVDALTENELRLDKDLILEIQGSKESERSKARLFVEKQKPTAIFVTTGTPVGNI